MDDVVARWTHKQWNVRAVYRPGSDPLVFSPVTQAAGFAFTRKGLLLVGRTKGSWKIPGGKIDRGEHPDDTFRREVMEELTCKVSLCACLGAQEIFIPGYSGRGGEHFFQLRYVGIIDEVLPIAPDPDKGVTWSRKFIEPKAFSSTVEWGAVADRFLQDALACFEHWKKTGNLH
jgi:8-oxo-dGTP pyrophosphatase MutT (NUDIX family)